MDQATNVLTRYETACLEQAPALRTEPAPSDLPLSGTRPEPQHPPIDDPRRLPPI